MNLGYASKTLGLPEGRMRSLAMKSATEERLLEAIAGNLDALEAVIGYCERNGIGLFRIGSDVVPFGSSPVNQLDWRGLFAGKLAEIGAKARAYGIRLSMHPGQYTVLSSPDQAVVENAVADLVYHASFLDALGLARDAKVILHVGGAYGDKQAALDRFAKRYRALDENVRARLVIENDDRLYTAEDVLSLSETCGAPVVFDVLHHRLNHEPDARSEMSLVDAAGETWAAADGRQKIHYSQQAFGRKPGSHSDTIELDAFLEFAASLQDRSPDIMLEVKDKNISAAKCVAALDPRKKVAVLEREWARYKYSVLEHDQAAYQEIRRLLKDKDSYPALPFYHLVEKSLKNPVSTGSAVNAAQHVWGYFSNLADARERASFERALARYAEGAGELEAVKRRLSALAERYGQSYLAHSYYFAL